jgi:pSer/pThr/pTyr-binding forkhead associated (FHA) protein
MVQLQLLAALHGQPLQTWEFVDSQIIHIGRATECDVVISTPVVSRSHAYVKHEGTGWQLCAVSQNGVFVEGERVQTLPLQEGVIFRLAANGPFVRFSKLAVTESAVLNTVLPGESGVSSLVLDESRRNEQVDAIAEGPYFQQLQQLARQLRGQRDA